MSKDARVDIVLQRIEEDVGDELKVEPKHIRRYGVNNIFQRVFSYMLGWDITGKPKKLLCTRAGVLKTAHTGAGFEVCASNPSSFVDGYVTIVAAAVETETFKYVQSSIDIFTQGNDVKVRISPDGITFYSFVHIRGSINQTYSVDTICKSIRIQNVDPTGANDGKYQLVGWR